MRILLTGATGLVGQGVLRECLRDTGVAKIVALGRRASGQTDPKFSEIIVSDFAELGAVEQQLRPFDACFYCAGAPPLGPPEAEYRHVTFDLTTHVAQTLARLNPHMTLLYISGALADPKSWIMPLRIKGETEQALAALPIRTVMLRPGGVQPLQGVHSPHAGMAAIYKVAGPVMGLGVRLMPSLLTTTKAVALAMLKLARDPDAPPVVENARINQLGA